VNRAPPDELEDDGLARALGRLERERDAEFVEGRAPEWEAVARGELGVDEVAQLRLAAGDADVERATEYFRPFAANETSALVDGLLESVRTVGSVGSEAQEEAEPDNVVPFPRQTVEVAAVAEAADQPGPAKIHDPGSSKFWWIPGGLLATAAAAIVMFWVVPPSADVRELDNPVVATRDTDTPLPGYVLETDGGLKQLRGETEGETGPDDVRHRYHRDTEFEWVLRPKADFEHVVSVRAFAFVDGGRAGLPLPLDDLAMVAPTGAIRIAGKIAELDLEPGRYTIALAVGRVEDLPKEAGSVIEARDGTAFVVRRVDIVIED
jgi:hypothetical protein